MCDTKSLLLRQRFPKQPIFPKKKKKLFTIRLKDELVYCIKTSDFRNTFTLTDFPFKEKQPKSSKCLKTFQLQTFINNYGKLWLCKESIIYFSWCANTSVRSFVRRNKWHKNMLPMDLHRNPLKEKASTTAHRNWAARFTENVIILKLYSILVLL